MQFIPSNVLMTCTLDEINDYAAVFTAAVQGFSDVYRTHCRVTGERLNGCGKELVTTRKRALSAESSVTHVARLVMLQRK